MKLIIFGKSYDNAVRIDRSKLSMIQTVLRLISVDARVIKDL
ncbi:hypothetical protein E2C01_067421 [Portunus trituberculatus]|uniref:Uncharacterized protein n=1 Tax=Portunus trituberculatus TaxID=210409 RepID=A0A5B7HSK3_PORTR|nr:hypothetical protein [Portunus trituberculatus]